jgi:hypothetical protein
VSFLPIVARLTARGFERQVLRYAEQRGWRCYDGFDQRSQPPGFPRLVLTRARHDQPRVVFLELKGYRGRLTAKQRACLEQLRADGYEAYVFRPADTDRVVRVLR